MGVPQAPPRRALACGLRGMTATTLLSLLVTLFLFAACARAAEKKDVPNGDKYLLGVGKADITGPVVEINFAGYANPSQKGTGLRQRLFSRAFIIADANKPDDRFVYVVIDTQSGDTAVRYGVIDGLDRMGPEYAVYGQQNIALTGTHSHSGPGAWFNYLLPQITSFGFNKQSYQAIVDGVLLSIKRAHEGVKEGYLDIGTTTLSDGAINRSLYAYKQNPKKERAKYDASTDTTLTLLSFRRASDNKVTGVLTWFPVHGTSMTGNNTHVSGDNKGVAAWMLEEKMKEEFPSDDNEDFVAGFSQANVGDTTPNINGAFCDDGSPCSFEKSTCADDKSETCHGRGPFSSLEDFGARNCYEMGRRQYQAAWKILKEINTTRTAVQGSSVKSFHLFNDMRYFNFTTFNGTVLQTCPAALGYSFAAGTTDWPGAFDFTQADSGKPDANPVWRLVSGLLKTPSEKQKSCQSPKPILLDVGEMTKPYAWTPNIVDVQMLRVGQLVMIISPSEATTMSGRRWRDAVSSEANSFVEGIVPIVVLGGPANSYSHYLATPEEYEVQRYEGASTLFGRNTLAAFINLTVSNMHYLHPDSVDHPGQTPKVKAPDNRKKMISLVPGVVIDGHPDDKPFGFVIEQPKPPGPRKGDVVKARFQGANPRNNLRLEGTFVAVERFNGLGIGKDGNWTEVVTDRDWHLTYTWNRGKNKLSSHSTVEVAWETDIAKEGLYRFKYYGDAKESLLSGHITAFEGATDPFHLV